MVCLDIPFAVQSRFRLGSKRGDWQRFHDIQDPNFSLERSISDNISRGLEQEVGRHIYLPTSEDRAVGQLVIGSSTALRFAMALKSPLDVRSILATDLERRAY